MVQPDKTQTTERRLRFACWTTKVTHTHTHTHTHTNTHSEYVILIAFPRLLQTRHNVTFTRTLPVLLDVKVVVYIHTAVF